MNGEILVTGATGNLGASYLAAARLAGQSVRLGGRRVEQLRGKYPGLPAVCLDFEDPRTFDAALHGAAGLFLVRPPAISRVGSTVNVLLDRAAVLGVEHVVFVSVAGAESNSIVPHHRIEQHLRLRGLSHTILRPGFFAQNLGDAYRQDICRDDRIFLPAGQGEVAFVDVRDLGDLSARIFLDPSLHRGHGYRLTGSRAMPFGAVVQILSQELGRHIRYEPASIPAYALHLRRQGMAYPQILVQTVLHSRIRLGEAAPVDDSLARLLEREPRSLEEYVRDHRELWQ